MTDTGFVWRVKSYHIVVVGLFVLMTLWWPKSASVNPDIENGAKAALSAIRHRRAAEDALAHLRRVEKAADSVQVAAIRTTARQAARVDTVFRDSARLVDGDSVVSLGLARAELAAFRDSSTARMIAIQDAHHAERQAADSAIRHLQATILAQDTVIAGLQAKLRERPSFWIRGIRGVEHFGAGMAGAGIGYVLAGPLGAIGGGILAAAVTGVVR